MLKIVGKFEGPFIVNFNLFITTLFNDSKSHVNMFIILNSVIYTVYKMQLPTLEKCNPNEIA